MGISLTLKDEISFIADDAEFQLYIGAVSHGDEDLETTLALIYSDENLLSKILLSVLSNVREDLKSLEKENDKSFDNLKKQLKDLENEIVTLEESK